MRDDGSWTELGLSVSDLLLHESWQQGDEFADMLRDHFDVLAGAVLAGAVLDVGCSTGRTLRKIRHAKRRVGVDIDEEALALGYRLAEVEAEDVEFRCASAHQLPFDDLSFDCVICRNALTYTYQRRAMQEMLRVLRPGGLLFLRYENFRYDLQRLLSPARAKVRCCRLRDFAVGIVCAVLGWQPQPGTHLAPGRVFGSTLRIRWRLRAGGCSVLDTADSRECPRLLGRANQTSLLARKAWPQRAGTSDRSLLEHLQLHALGLLGIGDVIAVTRGFLSFVSEAADLLCV